MAKERFFNLPVLILIASSFMLGMSEFIMVGILPDIAVGLKVSEVTVGNLVSLFAFVYAPVTPLGSALSARFPRFATHMTLIGVFLAGNLLCAFAPNYAVLMAGRILIALVSGTLVAIAMTYARCDHRHLPHEIHRMGVLRLLHRLRGGCAGRHLGGQRVRLALGVPSVNALTVVLIIGMVAVLPHNSHAAKIGFLSQFRLFFDRRIQLGVLDVVCGAAASYVFYTYLTPIMRDEVHVPEQYLSVGLVIFGAACLWSNLYGGKLADRGRGVEPLTHIRPIYCAHAVLMASLVVAHWVPVYGALLLVVLGMFMYLQNSASQVLYMDVASQSHPGSLNLAASLNSMSFNIGIALGSAVGGLVNGHFGLTWFGPVGALFLLCAIATTTMLRPFVAQERKFYATQRA